MQKVKSLKNMFLQTAPVCYSEIILVDQVFKKKFILTLGQDIDQTGLACLAFSSEQLRTNTYYVGMLNASNIVGPALSVLQIGKLWDEF